MAKNHKSFNYELMFLILILIFGFFLRVYELGYSPFWIDEAISSIASRSIVENGFPIFDSGLTYNRAYVFHYFQAFFLLFGMTDFNARLVCVLFGMLTIVLAYFIGREYSKAGGLLGALFTAVFYLEVFFSRQARFYQLFQLMFFLSIYLLYKSGECKNKNGNKSKKSETIYLVLAIVAFFIALDTQIAALVLAPFLIVHILVYNTKYNKYLAIIPLIPLISKFMPAVSLSSVSSASLDPISAATNYADQYFGFTLNLRYLLILFIPGVLINGLKKWKLTVLMVLPSIIILVGIFSLQTFALRYAYFIVFPIIIYSSVLIGFLYNKLGKVVILLVLFLLVFPSNLVYPYTYVNVIKPTSSNHGYSDYSSPETNYKVLPEGLIIKLRDKNNNLVSLFSSDVEWYIRKPDYVIPFSMTGVGEDQISFNKTINGVITAEIVDRYSGAPILINNTELKRPYYVTRDRFSYSKLKSGQRERFDKLVNGCEIAYSAEDLKVYECS